MTAGERLYRSDIFGDGELIALGEPIASFDEMVETRGRVSRAQFPEGPPAIYSLWSGYFDERRIDDDAAWTLRAQVGVGWPVPALRDGDTGWRLFSQVILLGDVDQDFAGFPAVVGVSSGLTISGDDGGLIGTHADGFDARAEVIEMW